MSIEKGSRPEETDEELRKWLSSSGLSGDSINLWIPITLVAEGDGDIEELEPLETYEQYATRGPHTENEARRLIEMSNPDSIRKFNDLATRYNADLSRIKAEKDLQAAIDYYNQADLLIRREKAQRVLLDG